MEERSAVKPTIGRIVHFYDDDDRGPVAAIVTGVYLDEELVDLALFHGPMARRNAESDRQSIRRADTGEGPRWTWPPKEGQQ